MEELRGRQPGFQELGLLPDSEISPPTFPDKGAIGYNIETGHSRNLPAEGLYLHHFLRDHLTAGYHSVKVDPC